MLHPSPYIDVQCVFNAEIEYKTGDDDDAADDDVMKFGNTCGFLARAI